MALVLVMVIIQNRAAFLNWHLLGSFEPGANVGKRVSYPEPSFCLGLRKSKTAPSGRCRTGHMCSQGWRSRRLVHCPQGSRRGKGRGLLTWY
jgi:hypothetical protein